MKKLCVLFLIIVCVLSLNFLQEQFLQDVFYDNFETIYLNLNSQNNKIVGGEKIKNGTGEIVKLSRSEYFNNAKYITTFAGVSLVIKNLSVEEVAKKLNLKIVDSYEINNLKVVVGYSNKLKSALFLNNKKFNVQIAYDNNFILVGNPLILQGF